MTVLIDTHEPKEIETYLAQIGVPIERKSLEVGDYVISDWILERKTVQDLFGSVYHGEPGKLWRQLEALSATDRKAVIIEGIAPLRSDTEAFNSFWGIYLGISLGWKTPVIRTNSVYETARVIKEIYRKLNSPKPFLRPLKRVGLSKEEIRSDVLCCVPGIGRKQASLLLKEKGTLIEILKTPLEELCSIGGVRRRAMENLREIFYG